MSAEMWRISDDGSLYLERALALLRRSFKGNVDLYICVHIERHDIYTIV